MSNNTRWPGDLNQSLISLTQLEFISLIDTASLYEHLCECLTRLTKELFRLSAC